MNSNNLSPIQGVSLSISIVVYRPDEALLARTMLSLSQACAYTRERMPGFEAELVLVDNGGLGDVTDLQRALRGSGVACATVSGHGNVGYGRGHNLAIERVSSRYHLVLNPDIDIAQSALFTALTFLDAHQQAGLLTPSIRDDDGGLQYLCRRFPTLIDLVVRGFAPAGVRRRFSARLARYEMRDVITERDPLWDPPIASGCFMLFRTELLKQLKGFDSRYFLYFEDYDLSLRTHNLARIAYVPDVQVVHHGGGASRKGWAHIRMFGVSAFRFFNRFGWRLW